MADIDVVKKSSNMWIVWLIAAIALIVILWAVFGSRSTGQRDAVGRADLPAAEQLAPRIDAGALAG